MNASNWKKCPESQPELSDNAENSSRYHDDELFRQRSKVGHKYPGLNVT